MALDKVSARARTLALAGVEREAQHCYDVRPNRFLGRQVVRIEAEQLAALKPCLQVFLSLRGGHRTAPLSSRLLWPLRPPAWPSQARTVAGLTSLAGWQEWLARSCGRRLRLEALRRA